MASSPDFVNCTDYGDKSPDLTWVFFLHHPYIIVHSCHKKWVIAIMHHHEKISMGQWWPFQYDILSMQHQCQQGGHNICSSLTELKLCEICLIVQHSYVCVSLCAHGRLWVHMCVHVRSASSVLLPTVLHICNQGAVFVKFVARYLYQHFHTFIKLAPHTHPGTFLISFLLGTAITRPDLMWLFVLGLDTVAR